MAWLWLWRDPLALMTRRFHKAQAHWVNTYSNQFSQSPWLWMRPCQGGGGGGGILCHLSKFRNALCRCFIPLRLSNLRKNACPCRNLRFFKRVVICHDFILWAFATFWPVSLVGIYPGRAVWIPTCCRLINRLNRKWDYLQIFNILICSSISSSAKNHCRQFWHCICTDLKQILQTVS